MVVPSGVSEPSRRLEHARPGCRPDALGRRSWRLDREAGGSTAWSLAPANGTGAHQQRTLGKAARRLQSPPPGSVGRSEVPVAPRPYEACPTRLYDGVDESIPWGPQSLHCGRGRCLHRYHAHCFSVPPLLRCLDQLLAAATPRSIAAITPLMTRLESRSWELLSPGTPSTVSPSPTA
jgi:hypothetical protein